jgi:hypothetical protein
MYDILERHGKFDSTNDYVDTSDPGNVVRTREIFGERVHFAREKRYCGMSRGNIPQ